MLTSHGPSDQSRPDVIPLSVGTVHGWLHENPPSEQAPAWHGSLVAPTRIPQRPQDCGQAGERSSADRGDLREVSGAASTAGFCAVSAGTWLTACLPGAGDFLQPG